MPRHSARAERPGAGSLAGTATGATRDYASNSNDAEFNSFRRIGQPIAAACYVFRRGLDDIDIDFLSAIMWSPCISSSCKRRLDEIARRVRGGVPGMVA